MKDQLHAGDFVLPSLLEEAGKKAGDLIILSRPATSTESSHTSGAYVNYGDVPEEPEEPVELSIRSIRLLPASTRICSLRAMTVP